MRRLVAWLILLAAVFPAWSEDVDGLSSILLVAKKDMPDPFFRDSVVLVTHRAGPGPIGIILNRPTGINVSTGVPQAEKRPSNEVVFFGGPVGIEDLVVVFRTKDPPKNVIEVLEGVYMTSRRDLIITLLSRDPPVQDLRVYAGYAGWARGQLEAEVSRGDWLLARADAATLFEKKPEGLWPELFRKSSAKKASHDSSPPRRRGPSADLVTLP
ncbi:hypothetical protein BWI17_11370 [Betaproteobacteria bacterium GR16-43]|nr:hypothetical protein BWI17_11370 [Betaproteobacteria bacterium GR16-43]